MARENQTNPIGVFDSGVGGLTVVAAIRKLLPSENIYYLGDTARLPYGGKSQATIERYSVEISDLLLGENAKMIVVACNTASALALPLLKKSLQAPVHGVIFPGAEAAVRSTKKGRIGVMGTKATIASGAYQKAIHALNPNLKVLSQPCPMLVPLIEEALLEDPQTDEFLRRYLEPLLAEHVDTLVLGCTHYPLLKPAIQRIAGDSVLLVDSAENCALAVRAQLQEAGLSSPTNQEGRLDVALTDSSSGFLHVAKEALDLQIDGVHLRAIQSNL